MGNDDGAGADAGDGRCDSGSGSRADAGGAAGGGGAGCILFYLLSVTFPNVESVAVTASILRWNMNAVVNTTVRLGEGP